MNTLLPTQPPQVEGGPAQREAQRVWHGSLSPPHSRPEEGNVAGVLHNKRFVVRININEDLDNEFEYLGGEGFTFIPYKETNPIIGGISSDSIYYKSTKRQLGILDNEDGTDTVVDVEFKRIHNKIITELDARVYTDE